jgi:hypothetical protein
MKQIFIPIEIKKEILQEFKVSNVTLWSALQYTTNSGKAKMLRSAALQRGGVIYTGSKPDPGFISDCHITFETADNTMTQLFSNKVSVVVDFTHKTVTMYADGKVESTYENATIEEFGEIQMAAMDLANKIK